jgi:hypothetical protein
MNMTNELSHVADITFIEPEKARFYVLDRDFLGLVYDGADKKRVNLHRALPVHSPDEYICVLDAEAKEIGIIRTLAGFSPEQAELIGVELRRRYYNPVVHKIISAKEKMGYVYFELLTTAGRKSIAVKDISKSIRRLDEKRILILDVDGNRYLIEDGLALDRASMKCIESYLF